MKKAIVLLAEGFEEIEALTPVDYLRRAGIEVTVAGIGGREIRGAHGIRVEADSRVEDAGSGYDCVIVPGGMPGSKNIAASMPSILLIREAFAEGRLVAAICAAPVVVLANSAGVLKERKYTCYPGMEKESSSGTFIEGKEVVVDGNLITSRAAGTADQFSAAIIQSLMGREFAKGVAEKVHSRAMGSFLGLSGGKA
jgi:protein deglycase